MTFVSLISPLLNLLPSITSPPLILSIIEELLKLEEELVAKGIITLLLKSLFIKKSLITKESSPHQIGAPKKIYLDSSNASK